MMRKRLLLPLLPLLPLLTALAACGQGDPGSAGPDGPDGAGGPSCTATEQGGRWLVQCPDGSRADLDLASCELEEDGDGAQRIRCPDGSEATVLPDAGSLSGSIAGKVQLEAAPSSAGVLVELIGTELTARSGTDGSFRLEGVAPGNYELRLSLPPYIPQVVAGISSFGGTFEVGTVLLRNVRRLPEDILEYSFEAEIVLSAWQAYAEIYDLAADELHRVMMPAGTEFSDATIRDDGIVLLLARNFVWDDYRTGTWRAGEGVRWYGAADYVHVATKGTLIERSLPGGAITLLVDRGGVETSLELEGIEGVQQIGDQARWMVTTLDRTVLVDAEDGAPTTTEVAASICFPVDVEEMGLIGLVLCSDGAGLYDFSRASWIARGESFRTISTMRGAGLWALDSIGSDLNFYDGFSGNTFVLPAGGTRNLSEPTGKWLWSTDGGDLLLERRDGEVTHTFAELPLFFSPDEERFAAHEGDLLHLVDLGSGELRTFEDLADCAWINAEGLLCGSVTTGGAVIVGLDGGVQELEPSPDYDLEAGWLVYQPYGRTKIVAPGRGSFELGAVQELSFSKDGASVAWINSVGALYALHLETGEKVRLAQEVQADLEVLDTGALFTGYAFPFGAAPLYVPYPW